MYMLFVIWCSYTK